MWEGTVGRVQCYNWHMRKSVTDFEGLVGGKAGGGDKLAKMGISRKGLVFPLGLWKQLENNLEQTFRLHSYPRSSRYLYISLRVAVPSPPSVFFSGGGRVRLCVGYLYIHISPSTVRIRSTCFYVDLSDCLGVCKHVKSGHDKNQFDLKSLCIKVYSNSNSTFVCCRRIVNSSNKTRVN